VNRGRWIEDGKISFNIRGSWWVWEGKHFEEWFRRESLKKLWYHKRTQTLTNTERDRDEWKVFLYFSWQHWKSRIWNLQVLLVSFSTWNCSKNLKIHIEIYVYAGPHPPIFISCILLLNDLDLWICLQCRFLGSHIQPSHLPHSFSLLEYCKGCTIQTENMHHRWMKMASTVQSEQVMLSKVELVKILLPNFVFVFFL